MVYHSLSNSTETNIVGLWNRYKFALTNLNWIQGNWFNRFLWSRTFLGLTVWSHLNLLVADIILRIFVIPPKSNPTSAPSPGSFALLCYVLMVLVQFCPSEDFTLLHNFKRGPEVCFISQQYLHEAFKHTSNKNKW